MGKKTALRARLDALCTAAAQNRAIMLRLPRQAHYSICDNLCARDTARLIETASQWSREDDPRRAALHACVADRVARARAVTGYVGEIVSTLQFIEAVERRDWEITPTGRDGDCNGQLEKILRSYTMSLSDGYGLKDGDDIVFPPGEYRLVRTVKLYIRDCLGERRIPQITLRGVGGPSKALLYADTNTSFCLFHIRGPTDLQSSVPNPVIQFSGLAFRNDSGGRTQRNSIVCCQGGYPKIHRVNDCHVRTLRCLHRRQDAGGHLLQCAKMEKCLARRLCDCRLCISSDSESEGYIIEVN